jgi:hypothetical protein
VTYSSRPDYQQAVDLQNRDCSNFKTSNKTTSKILTPSESDDVRDNQYDNSCFERENVHMRTFSCSFSPIYVIKSIHTTTFFSTTVDIRLRGSKLFN